MFPLISQTPQTSKNFNNAKKSYFTMMKQDFLVSLYPYSNTPERMRDNVSGVICR